jgi:AcrR family transcriptional regulator
MVQVLKDHVKNQIASAAERMFAKVGYKQATVGMIANEARVSTGNIYKYFKNKETLFNAIITSEFVEEFKLLTQNRLATLIDPAKKEEVRSINSGAAGQLLRFWIKNRLKVIIILAKSEGSIYESFSHEYIQSITQQSMDKLPLRHPSLRNTDVFRFIFDTRLKDTIRGIVSILETFENEEQIIDAFTTSWAYHYAGINAVIAWCSQHVDQ